MFIRYRRHLFLMQYKFKHSQFFNLQIHRLIIQPSLCMLLTLPCEKCYRVLKAFFPHKVCMYMYMKIKRYGTCTYTFIVTNTYDKQL